MISFDGNTWKCSELIVALMAWSMAF